VESGKWKVESGEIWGEGQGLMNAIVAVDMAWGIGYNGKQTIVIPEDRAHFKETTSGGVIIVGRKTFEEFPGPLPDRKNIVLTRDRNFSAGGAVVVHSIDEALSEVSGDDPEKVYVAGGGEIYRLLLPLCRLAYVTKIETGQDADVFFPNLDILPNWSIEREIKSIEHDGVRCTILEYRNNGI